MASRAKASKNAPGDKGATSTRPSRLRVMHPDVEEVLRSPRRGRPKQRQQQQGVDEDGPPARYNCAFQHEGGRHDFAPPDLVWGKVRSHPWWPGQVFDAADASELALQHARAGASLVAYFWDKTFAWSDSSALLPFRTNFTRLAGHSTMSGFVSAVDAALQEVGRRLEAGLSCACFATRIAKKQEIENSGIREGAYGAVVDAAYMRDTFRGKAFLDYISALGKNPLAGVDRLDLATARAQLRAFNRTRGPRDIPEFVIFEGIEDVAKVIPHAKRKRMEKSGGDDVPSKEKKSKRGESSLRKKEALLEAAKKDDMDEDSSMPSRGASDDTLNKERKSKHRESSVKKKKKKDTSKNADEPETAGGSKMSDEKAVDDVLGENKSGRRLRSARKMEDALEGLKGLGKDDGGKTSKGKNKDVALPKENKLRHRASSAHKKDKSTGDGDELGDGSAKDSVSPGKKRSGRGENSVTKKAPISEHGRKKKKLSELMDETGRPNSAPGDKSKARGKHSWHASTEKLGDPDCDSKDTVKNRRGQKLNTLGDLSSQSQPFSHKKSTKVRELMLKAAGQKSQSQTPPVLKANGAASQTRSRRARQVTAADKSLRSTKVNKGKKDALTEDSMSCGEMLSQLSLAARDLKKREKIAPTSVNFFTDFRKNSYASSSDVNKEIPKKPANTNSYASSSHVNKDIPEKATTTEPIPSEQPLADHMRDDYWADILINVEEPLSSLRKKKDKGKSRTSKKARHVKEVAKKSSVSLGNAEEPSVEGKQNSENGKQPKAETKPSVANGAQLNAETKPSVANGAQLYAETRYAEEMENYSLAGLVLQFSRPSAVPSRSDLIKIFSQYGPVNEAKTEIANNANCAQVIFKRRMDAEVAFSGAGKISALGPALVSFRLTDFPAATSGNEPRQGKSKSE